MSERVCVCVRSPLSFQLRPHRVVFPVEWPTRRCPPCLLAAWQSPLLSPSYLAKKPGAASLLTPGRRSLRGVGSSLSSVKISFPHTVLSSRSTAPCWPSRQKDGQEPPLKFARGWFDPLLLRAEREPGQATAVLPRGLPPSLPCFGGSFCSRCARRGASSSPGNSAPSPRSPREDEGDLMA